MDRMEKFIQEFASKFAAEYRASKAEFKAEIKAEILAELQGSSSVPVALVKPKICCIPGCDLPITAKGICANHYSQYVYWKKKDELAKFMGKYGLQLNGSKFTVSFEVPTPVFIPTIIQNLTDPIHAATSDVITRPQQADDVITSAVVIDPPLIVEPDLSGSPIVPEKSEVCLVPNCGKLITARGLCSTHYQKYRIADKEGKLGDYLASNGLTELPMGRRGRKPNSERPEPVVSQATEFLKAVEEWSVEKSLNAQSVQPNKLMEVLAQQSCITQVEPDIWSWELPTDVGYLIFDRVALNLIFRTHHRIQWEGQVFERNLILLLAHTFSLKAVRINNENVPVSKFESYYLLPERASSRFFAVATDAFHNDFLHWDKGDAFSVYGFAMIGKVLQRMEIWLKARPAYDSTRPDPVSDEFEKAKENLRVVGMEHIFKHFNLVYNGESVPNGVHPNLLLASTYAQPNRIDSVSEVSASEDTIIL